MIRQLTAVGAAIGASILSTPAMAASCAERDTVVERLQSQYDETYTAGGLQTVRDKQTLVEVWASQKTGTFTVMLTMPDGVTCVVATGTDWHQRDADETPPGESS
ncbi:MAG: hypothetical protein AAFW87_10480 [Pseudomonadota bacterium]